MSATGSVIARTNPVLDVYKSGMQIGTMTPERRFYKAIRQTSTLPDIRSSLEEDLYLVFEGLNPDNGHPILKAHLKPLVIWVWIGVCIMPLGTVLALIPNSSAPVRVPAAARLRPVYAEPALTGD